MIDRSRSAPPSWACRFIHRWIGAVSRRNSKVGSGMAWRLHAVGCLMRPFSDLQMIPAAPGSPSSTPGAVQVQKLVLERGADCAPPFIPNALQNQVLRRTPCLMGRFMVAYIIYTPVLPKSQKFFEFFQIFSRSYPSILYAFFDASKVLSRRRRRIAVLGVRAVRVPFWCFSLRFVIQQFGVTV